MRFSIFVIFVFSYTQINGYMISPHRFVSKLRRSTPRPPISSHPPAKTNNNFHSTTPATPNSLKPQRILNTGKILAEKVYGDAWNGRFFHNKICEFTFSEIYFLEVLKISSPFKNPNFNQISNHKYYEIA